MKAIYHFSNCWTAGQ